MAKRWTPEELDILDRFYPEGGSRAVHEALPHRPMGSIKTVACWRAVKVANRHPWTVEEAAIALKNYPPPSAKRTAAMLPGRAPQDIRVYCNMRGVHRVREFA